MTSKLIHVAALLGLLMPGTAMAYLNPEDVLLNRDMFLPPSAREAQDRTDLQANEAAARREREQERAFSVQHPEPEPAPVIEEDLHGAAPALPEGAVYVYPVPLQESAGFGQQLFGAAPTQGLTDTANLELMRTMRLLDRVNQNQVAAQFQAQVLHSAASDLAPTGAGSVAAATVMLGSVLYVMRRANRMKAIVRS